MTDLLSWIAKNGGKLSTGISLIMITIIFFIFLYIYYKDRKSNYTTDNLDYRKKDTYIYIRYNSILQKNLKSFCLTNTNIGKEVKLQDGFFYITELIGDCIPSRMINEDGTTSRSWFTKEIRWTYVSKADYYRANGNNNSINLGGTQVINSSNTRINSDNNYSIDASINEINNSSISNLDKEFLIDVVRSISTHPKPFLEKALEIAKEFALEITVSLLTKILVN